MHIEKKPLDWQLYFFQIFGIITAIVLSLVIALYYTIMSQYSSLDRTISNVSSALAHSEEAQRLLSNNGHEEAYVEAIDDLVSDLVAVDVVVICDTASIRHYHTNKSVIGQAFIGNDEYAILNGSRPYITETAGTMGNQRRAFHAIKNSQDQIIGFVMTAVLTTSITRSIRDVMTTYIVLGCILILLGVLFAKMINRRIKKTLMGYRPEEFSRMYVERAEVMDSLEEGIFAINTEGEVILMNNSAMTMLNLTEIPSKGTKLVDIYPETRLPRILESGAAEYNISTVIHRHNILSNRIPVIENDKIIGAVSIFRDKTEVNKLAEELTGARYMVDTLRAFNHEFKNKLHVILGYVEMNQPEKVVNLILNSSMVSTQAVSEVTQKIHVPGIAALLIGKIIRGSELGINVMIKHESECMEETLTMPVDIYITIIGNLMENALEALNHPELSLKEIEVGINTWATGCIISVDDTGNGIPDEAQSSIFEKGYSTKGPGRGTGLYLIKDLVERYHGHIDLVSEVGTGTSFTITFNEEQQSCIE